MLSLYPYLEDNLESTLFIAPDAPNINIAMDQSFYWYNVGSLNPEYLMQELQTITPQFDRYISELKAKYKLENKDIYLYGFSQGALLILHYGLSQAEGFAGLIAHSGGMIPAAFQDQTCNDSNICLIHGEDDMVIPCETSQKASSFLDEQNIPNTLHIIKNLDHSINPLSISLTKQFIDSTLTHSK